MAHLFMGLGAILGGLALVVSSKRMATLIPRINKAIFGIRQPSWPSRIVILFAGVSWLVIGLWVLFNFFAQYL